MNLKSRKKLHQSKEIEHIYSDFFCHNLRNKKEYYIIILFY